MDFINMCSFVLHLELFLSYIPLSLYISRGLNNECHTSTSLFKLCEIVLKAE